MKLVQLLQDRLKTKDVPEKMQKLARRSGEGMLTSFGSIFGEYKISEQEMENLKSLLERFSDDPSSIESDFESLCLLTAEVKAINNQAALLHGERIQKAQTILKGYREGAFTSWLIETYGNRQTPYNLLQYYEFYSSMPTQLRPIVDAMPRQAIYSLASRAIPIEEKKTFVKNYQGETKQELLDRIRRAYPLDEGDKREQNLAENWVKLLEKAYNSLKATKPRFSRAQKKRIDALLKSLEELV